MWKKILRHDGFRNFYLGSSFYSLLTWLSAGLIPLFVIETLGSGSEVVFSLGARILPRVFGFTLGANFVKRFGAKICILATLPFMALATAGAPFCRDTHAFLGLIVFMGLLDTVLVPAILTMRAQVIPEGLAVQSNTIIHGTDRMLRVIGPALAGILYKFAGGPMSFTIAAAMALFAGICVYFVGPLSQTNPSYSSGALRKVRRTRVSFLGIPREMKNSFTSFTQLVGRDELLRGTLIPAFAYLVTLGALRPFLIWHTSEVGASPESWTTLLSAQGAGALAGSLVFGAFSSRILRRWSVYHVYFVACLLEGLLLIPLAVSTNLTSSLGWIALSGVPEIVAYITYFTIVQERLSVDDMPTFYGVSLPLFEGFFALGTYSALLYSAKWLSLSQFWLLAAALGFAPILPYARAFWNARANEINRS